MLPSITGTLSLPVRRKAKEALHHLGGTVGAKPLKDPSERSLKLSTSLSPEPVAQAAATGDKHSSARLDGSQDQGKRSCSKPLSPAACRNLSGSPNPSASGRPG